MGAGARATAEEGRIGALRVGLDAAKIEAAGPAWTKSYAEVGRVCRPKNDDGYVTTKVEDAAACQALCDADTTCGAWEYENYAADDRECELALCVEEEPGSDAILRFNEKLTLQSGGRLPPVVKTQMRYGAISCNHTVLFLRCVAHRMASDDEAATDAPGPQGQPSAPRISSNILNTKIN